MVCFGFRPSRIYYYSRLKLCSFFLSFWLTLTGNCHFDIPIMDNYDYLEPCKCLFYASWTVQLLIILTSSQLLIPRRCVLRSSGKFSSFTRLISWQAQKRETWWRPFKGELCHREQSFCSKLQMPHRPLQRVVATLFRTPALHPVLGVEVD